jgi:hypothetical protein
MTFMTAYPVEAMRYRKAGFDVFWNGITRNTDS